MDTNECLEYLLAREVSGLATAMRTRWTGDGDKPSVEHFFPEAVKQMKARKELAMAAFKAAL